MTQDIIRFEDVGLTLGGEVIYDHLSFAVAHREFVCILGPSGCGKSTSLRLMGGLIPIDRGSVTIGGRPPREAWQDLAYVFQSPRLVPWRNSLHNVTLAMELRFGSVAKGERETKARALLALVGLEQDMHKYPAALSGGERQRVAIARALAVDPKIILMDEPFSALDVKTRRRLRTELITIWQRTGKTIVFVTHDIEEALVLADRIIVLSAKPTRVVETLSIVEPRPRDVESSPNLQHRRSVLHRQFAFAGFEDQAADLPAS